MTAPIRERPRPDVHHAQGAAAPAPRSVAAEASRTRPSAPDYDRVPDAPHYLHFLAHVGRHPEMERPVRLSEAERAAALASRRADAEARARLDAFRAAVSGPYVVEGKPVQARPMFRMIHGANERNARARENELRAICARAKLPGHMAGHALVGRPTPEELRRVTQALIDAGKLAPGLDDTLEARIRQMQWEWGIGVDCAGYTEQAARAGRGAKAAPPSMGDVFTGLRHDPTVQKVAVADIRPGDVIHLDPPSRDEVGHNVVVYDHHVAGPEERARLAAAKGRGVEAFLAGAGPFHVIQVDSSWGAGPRGGDHGGFRRDTWLYDESTFTWGYFDAVTKQFKTSETGPHDEPYTGAVRPKVAS